jgi:hypothetical protein
MQPRMKIEYFNKRFHWAAVPDRGSRQTPLDLLSSLPNILYGLFDLINSFFFPGSPVP